MGLRNGLNHPVCGIVACTNPPQRCIKEIGHNGPHDLRPIEPASCVSNAPPIGKDEPVVQGDDLVTVGLFAALIVLAIAFTAFGYVLAGGGAC